MTQYAQVSTAVIALAVVLTPIGVWANRTGRARVANAVQWFICGLGIGYGLVTISVGMSI